LENTVAAASSGRPCRRRVSALALAIGLAVSSAASALAGTERDVTVPAEPAPLHGTLMLPDAAPRAGVLLIAGSGPVDRDGNLPGVNNDSLKLLAQALAERGVATIRTDKRGIGASRAAMPPEEDLRVETYVGDAVAWLGVLRAETSPARVFVLGHGEGALIGALAAQRTDVAGLILIAGAGTPPGPTIERQLADSGAPMASLETAHDIIVALERGELVSDPPPELAALFRPSVQPYLASWLRLDPAAELARLRVPALIIQGTTDLQASVADARQLAAARPDATLALIAGMNHVLKPAPEARAANLATYADPSLPLAPGLVAAIMAFVAP
jgi:alpha-beta hydrolase superfamily lysophospholipase